MSEPRRTFLKQVVAGTTAALAASNRAIGDPQAAPPRETKPMDSEHFRERLLTALGGPWPEPGPLNTRVREEKPGKGYRLLSVTYEAEPNQPIPAFLLVPDGASAARPRPAVAVWHEHAGRWHVGKDEPAGLGGDRAHAPAALLSQFHPRNSSMGRHARHCSTHRSEAAASELRRARSWQPHRGGSARNRNHRTSLCQERCDRELFALHRGRNGTRLV